MNAPFLHRRLQALETVLSAANVALRAHSAGDPAAVPGTIGFLTDAAAVYAGQGMATAENECLSLRAAVTGARPEPGSAGRREAQRGAARWAMAESSRRLRTELDRTTETLGRARDEIGVLMHHAVENGLLDPDGDPADEEGARRVWRVLVTAPGTRSAARLLALRVAIPDVLLLIDDRRAALAAAVQV